MTLIQNALTLASVLVCKKKPKGNPRGLLNKNIKYIATHLLHVMQVKALLLTKFTTSIANKWITNEINITFFNYDIGRKTDIVVNK